MLNVAPQKERIPDHLRAMAEQDDKSAASGKTGEAAVFVRAHMHTASEEVRPRPSPLAPPPSASEAAKCREPTSLLGRIASPS